MFLISNLRTGLSKKIERLSYTQYEWDRIYWFYTKHKDFSIEIC